MRNKILAILPESIGGRLTMQSLFKGFEKCGFDVDIFDVLNGAEEKISKLNLSEYKFLVSYDFVGVKLKKNLGLDIQTINYFSDVIESNCSGSYWQDCYAELASSDNYVFYWDKALSEKSKKSGDIKNLFYLPHAVDLDIYKNLNLPSEYDVMFAGRLTYGTRVNRFLNILKALPNAKFALYCFEKHLNEVCQTISEEDATLLRSVYKGFIDTEEKMNEAINKSKIVINFTSQGESSLNYRVFQTLACERVLITDFKSESDELFSVGQDFLCYSSDDELVEKVNEVLTNYDKYSQLGKNGRKTIENRFSSEKAVQKIIDYISV